MKKTKETYWAVRIGNPKDHLPYFMLQKDSMFPQLFLRNQEANFAAKQTGRAAKAVKVILEEQ